MALDHPDPTTSMMHATLGLDTLQSIPLPPMPYAWKNSIQDQQQQQRIVFCLVYSALLDDVQALDCLLESKFSKEILRIVDDFATSFGIRNQEAPEFRQFTQRLECLNQLCHSTEVFQGLSGATAVDYLVALMIEKSGSEKFKTLGNYQYHLANLNLAKAIRQISAMEEVPGQGVSPNTFLRGIGLPKVLFICVGPHTDNQSQCEGKDDGKKGHEEKDERAAVHVVASSVEAFADSDRTRWAQRIHIERMRSVSTQKYAQVCATERAFFTTIASGTLGGGDDKAESAIVKRTNIPHWRAMHHWPNSTTSAPASSTTSIAGAQSGTDARIGVFNHACETAGAFSVLTGFKRRARCFKCASVYLYSQDAASIRAEADMDGPHHSEPVYDWTAKGTGGERDGNDDGDGSLLIGPSCAEPLGHLLCSALMSIEKSQILLRPEPRA